MQVWGSDKKMRGGVSDAEGREGGREKGRDI